ncbi:MAG: Sec-dependent nitrous-oxide reductase [Lentimicrobiaceae bacterium]|jgi:nitrous-oxide reductase|nr:Sec-dependent nitrous-oxide reductase [Lentimicrobiaceae bacterium]MCP4910269.1 Sec-dependent nitrous-oxide reductase [Bacteroidota bacterium]MBT3454414.1 Sec-dependent nitrous-oxide reductase [Lentimicrobiaceae bacterium]MBT3818727.1 Sec-dependent nitrous-oxide reductase [Lentimicrobiaceae bacterium]MBT4062347.1 Sec-dependent nitrous-oxide reductase [Lentimicrobiaceae bacterium]
MKRILKSTIAIIVLSMVMVACGPTTSKKGGSKGVLSGSQAERAYVAPGEHDEYYGFISGGFSGQLAVYGLPSGRLFRVIPVFSQDPEKGYGYSEETIPMLMTSHGFVPWGDSHHPDISQTNGELDGRWIFINENNTPRVARISLETFETEEIMEIPNSAGNHSSAFVTENSEYVVAGTRFGVPTPQKDIPISEYKSNFKGSLTFLKIDPENGLMNIAFQIRMPGFNFDLAHPGRGDSHGWFFFSSYNTEEASTLLEVNASQNDKDFIAAINWKKIEEYVAQGVGTMEPARYAHNVWDDHTHTATTTMEKEVLIINPEDVPGAIYFLPTPKSPHGCDVDPTGEYIIGSGKLAATITVHSFSKMLKAIEDKAFDGETYSIPIINYEAVNYGSLEQPGLGPLHTEFDTRGNGYTTFFISSEVVKWNIKDLVVIDRKPTFYSVGHLMIPGGNSRKPFDKYLVAMNKITKDRYLPTGPEACQSAQLYDISGEKMELLLDFPTIGEPHYAAGCPADLLASKSVKIFKLEDNTHPYATKSEADSKVVRKGNEVHIYMTMIRSHFSPDNIEGVKVGDKVFFHVTNLEQDFDVPHGISMLGANTSELLTMPGRTETFVWEPKEIGVWPFYCTDFCSALHQEMQGYVRVSPKGSKIPISYTIDEEVPGEDL